MNFYKFLMEQGVVSCDKLLEAINLKLIHSPSMARLAVENNVISTDELEQIFALQNKKQMSFTKALSLSCMEAEKKLTEICILDSQSDHSITKFLIDNEIVEMRDLVASFDEYLAQAMREREAA